MSSPGISFTAATIAVAMSTRRHVNRTSRAASSGAGSGGVRLRRGLVPVDAGRGADGVHDRFRHRLTGARFPECLDGGAGVEGCGVHGVPRGTATRAARTRGACNPASMAPVPMMATMSASELRASSAALPAQGACRGTAATPPDRGHHGPFELCDDRGHSLRPAPQPVAPPCSSSAKTIAIVTVGLALAGLDITSGNSIRSEMQAMCAEARTDREAWQAEARALCAEAGADREALGRLTG